MLYRKAVAATQYYTRLLHARYSIYLFFYLGFSSSTP